MFFSLSSDYIKYLNDSDCHGMNYDQWKDKKRRQDNEQSKKRRNKKELFSSKYNY